MPILSQFELDTYGKVKKRTLKGYEKEAKKMQHLDGGKKQREEKENDKNNRP